MTVDTSELTCGKDGVLMCRLSTAILHGGRSSPMRSCNTGTDRFLVLPPDMKLR